MVSCSDRRVDRHCFCLFEEGSASGAGTAATAGTPAAPPAPPPPPPPAPRPRRRRAALTEEQIFYAKVSRSAERREAVDDVYFDYDKSDFREDGRASRSRRTPNWMKWTTHVVTVEGHARLARQSRVQPGARQPARHGREGIPGEPRQWPRAGSPSSARARSSRSAPRRTKPAGSRIGAVTSSLRRSRSEGREGQEGQEGQEGFPIRPIPPSQPHPPSLQNPSQLPSATDTSPPSSR